MKSLRFDEVVSRYAGLSVVVAGDYCLDRYLHIDAALEEVSLETRLPAHQVVAVRSQGGGAGNVLANVAALRPKELRAVGVCGQDGEGYELLAALRGLGANLSYFTRTARRQTFTYTKPLVIRPDQPPRELSRLDIRSRGPLPAGLAGQIGRKLELALAGADVTLFMQQTPTDSESVLCEAVRQRLAACLGARKGGIVAFADSRCDVRSFAGMDLKMNRQELHRYCPGQEGDEPAAIALARQLGQLVVVTLGEEGMLAARPSGEMARVKGIRVEPPIDIVGAGDAVLAHLAMALAAGAHLQEALELANLAGSIVVKKIGTTGTASVDELSARLQ